MTRDFLVLPVRAGSPGGRRSDAATHDCNPGGSVAACVPMTQYRTGPVHLSLGRPRPPPARPPPRREQFLSNAPWYSARTDRPGDTETTLNQRTDVNTR